TQEVGGGGRTAPGKRAGAGRVREGERVEEAVDGERPARAPEARDGTRAERIAPGGCGDASGTGTREAGVPSADDVAGGAHDAALDEPAAVAEEPRRLARDSLLAAREIVGRASTRSKWARRKRQPRAAIGRAQEGGGGLADLAVAARRGPQTAAVFIQRDSEPAEELRRARHRRPDGGVDLAGEGEALAARGIGGTRGPQVRAEGGVALEGQPVVAEEGLGRYGGPSGHRAARPHVLDGALGGAGPGERGGAACGGGRQARVVGARRRTGERSGAAERKVEAAHDREVPAHQEPPSGSAHVRLAGEEAPGLGGDTARGWMNCSRKGKLPSQGGEEERGDRGVRHAGPDDGPVPGGRSNRARSARADWPAARRADRRTRDAGTRSLTPGGSRSATVRPITRRAGGRAWVTLQRMRGRRD